MTARGGNPFKGLEPYGPGDELFGRDADLMLMKDRIFNARTTLLFACSGVGKTSFFRALFIPEIERRYSGVFTARYHNQWSNNDPLMSLKVTLRTDPRESLREFFAGGAQSDRASEGYIVVLDQFEELFQHQLYLPQLRQLIEELSEAINDTGTPTRFVLAMREEFLGHLSVFDNWVPDLFGNYYRLKNPDRAQAADIVTLTVERTGSSVESHGLEALLDDLTRVELRGGTAKGESVHREFVIPPHLQLVCRGLWDESAKRNGTALRETPFLMHYAAQSRLEKRNPARRMLKEFIVERMKNLAPDEQQIAARAFDYLVTSQGAKMAYELTSLSRHMGVKGKLLAGALEKLSRNTRILRESRLGSERWFELYHDMYAPIVYEWKERFDTRQKREDRQEAEAAAFDRRSVQSEAGERIGEALLFRLTALQRRGTDARRREAGRLLNDARGLVMSFRHEGRVLCAALSADAKQAVTASLIKPGSGPDRDKESLIQQWEAGTGHPVGVPIKMKGLVRAVAVSADGTRVAAISEKRVEVRHMGSARQLLSVRLKDLRLKDLRGGPVLFRFRDDGKALLLGMLTRGFLREVLALPIASKGPKIKLTTRPSVVAVNNGCSLLACARTGAIEVVDTATGKVLAGALIAFADVVSMTISPDSKRLATGERNGKVRLWSIPTLRPAGPTLSLRGAIRGLAFSRDGKTLYSLSASPRPRAFLQPLIELLQRWDIGQGMPAGEPVGIARRANSVRFSPDARFLCVEGPGVGYNGVVDTLSGTLLEAPWTLGRQVHTSWSGSDEVVLSSSESGTAELWRIRELRAAPHASVGLSGIGEARFNPEGTYIAGRSYDGRASLHYSSGEFAREICPGGVRSLAFGPGGCLATMTDDDKISLWDVESGRRVARVKTRVAGEIFIVPSGRGLLLAADTDDVVRWWGLRPRARALKPLRGAKGTLVLSRASDMVVFIGAEGRATLWNAAYGTRINTIAHEAEITIAAVSPNGELVLIGGMDGRARIRRVAATLDQATLSHQGPVSRAAFSRTGRWVATFSADGVLRVWSSRNGDEVGRMPWPDAVLSLDFTPDERLLMVATRSRVHLISVENGLEPRTSRRFTGVWRHEYRFRDRDGTRIQVLTSAALGHRTATLSFNSTEANAAAGRPKRLMEEWQRRTALTLSGEEVTPTALVRSARPTVPKLPKKRIDISITDLEEIPELYPFFGPH